MRRKNGKAVRAVNLAAKSLRLGQFRHRVVPDKKKYVRKGRNSSSNITFEDSFQFANSRGLIE